MKPNVTPLKLDNTQPNRWVLAGEVSMHTVSDQWSTLKKNRPTTGPWTIDCQQVSLMDTAGIALLLDCMRYAKAHQLPLSIDHLPEGAHHLIQAQGVATLFETP